MVVELSWTALMGWMLLRTEPGGKTKVAMPLALGLFRVVSIMGLLVMRVMRRHWSSFTSIGSSTGLSLETSSLSSTFYSTASSFSSALTSAFSFLASYTYCMTHP